MARLTGIEFKKVQVRKGLWSQGSFAAPNIALSNLYSQKILGHRIGDRSIWNLDPVERYIAPETLYEQLVESVGKRVSWNSQVDIARLHKAPVISTIPLPATLESLGIHAPFTFLRSAIRVERFRLPKTDVYQTVYYPDPDSSLYRASITGDVAILEYATTAAPFKETDAAELFRCSFGVDLDDAESLGTVEQKYGKIAPIEDHVRKQLLFQLTHDHNVFSLGRFAVWRNILLDDVVDDIAVIRRLMKSSSYDMRKEIA